MKALDLFCCSGGASLGLFAAGFNITGIDIDEQKNYPFNFIKANVINLGVAFIKQFDFVWASPPCQQYSASTRALRAKGKHYPDLIPIVRQLLRLACVPYVIENVEGSPLISPITLCGRMFGRSLIRHRLFESNFVIQQPPHIMHYGNEVPVYGSGTSSWYRNKLGRNITFQEQQKAMGLHHTTKRELTQAIPPDYSYYIAKQFSI